MSDNLIPEFLSVHKFWRNRYKFDRSILKYIYIIIWAIPNLLSSIIALSINVNPIAYILQGFMWLTLFIFAVFLGKRIPKEFQKTVLDKNTLFKTDQIHQEYLRLVKKNFGSKKEIIACFLFGIGWGFGYEFIYGISINFSTYDGIDILEEHVFLNVIAVTLNSIQFCVLGIIVLTSFFMLIFLFRSINQLGTQQYSLNINYKDLRIGTFNEIGQLVLLISIPALILSTTLSILGLVMVFIFDNFFVGFLEICLGIIPSTIIAILLYVNTIHIHRAIMKYKKDMKLLILDKIQINPEDPPESINFDKIESIHQFYYEVDKINDWPFNAKSLRKFTITFASSFLPLILSLLGL